MSEDVEKISPRSVNESDRQLGAELRRMREAANLTQAVAAKELGVSMQQYGKYERGENRIAASRFDDIKRVFQMTPDGESLEFLLDDFRRKLELIKNSIDRLIRQITAVLTRRPRL